MGSSSKVKSKQMESDDFEADSIYESIQDYMSGRHKRKSTAPTPLPSKRQELTPGLILAGLKPELATISEGTL